MRAYFRSQIESIVFIIHRSVLKIGEYPRIFPTFNWEIIAHVTHLDQSRASGKYLMDYKF